MKLRTLARSLVAGYMVVAAFFFAGIVGTALLLWQQGILDAETLRKIGRVLRKEPVGEVVKEKAPEKFARDVEKMKRDADEYVARRRRELDKESDFALVHKTIREEAARELKAREAAIAAKEKAFEAQIAQREAALRADELARSDKNFKLDLDLLPRLDAKDAAGLLKQMWDSNPDRVLLLFRSLRSRVAGEIYAELLKIEPEGKTIALKIQQSLTEGPGLSPSEIRRLVSKFADWEEDDLVAILRQMPKAEQEAFVREIASTNETLAAGLRGRLGISK